MRLPKIGQEGSKDKIIFLPSGDNYGFYLTLRTPIIRGHLVRVRFMGRKGYTRRFQLVWQ